MTTVSRSQVATTRDAGDGMAVGRQVFRSHLWQRSEHLNTNSEPNRRTWSTTSSQCSWLGQKWVSPRSNLRVFETIHVAELRTCCSLSIVFLAAPVRRLPQYSTRLVTNAWTSVATESSSRERRMRRSCHSWKKHLALTTLTCLSSDRSDNSWTPTTRTSSDLATWAAPSVKAWPEPGIFDKLCLVPVHISSVLSMLSLSRLAAIHCSIAVTHCWTLVTADCTFSGLQCTVCTVDYVSKRIMSSCTVQQCRPDLPCTG